MEQKMFYFQSKQTTSCSDSIESTGVRDKNASVSKLQDDLTGALVGLARATDNCPAVNDGTWQLMLEGLYATFTDVNFNEETLQEFIHRIHQEKYRLVPDCSTCASPCGRTADYDMNEFWNANEDIRNLKSLILLGLRGIAAYTHHAYVLGCTDKEVNHFFAKALFAIGEDWRMEDLLSIALEVGEKNLKCMALLNKNLPANK